MRIATYQAVPSKNGFGTFFYASCGHQMFSVKDDRAYQGCLCPGCSSKGKETVLYIRGSKEANKYQDERQFSKEGAKWKRKST